ncbi:MAG: hypothetical protein IT340_20015 [Chloroflexi bacterium]|nr:hypothetical protein [Chloroflexota bacterium]
MSFANQPTSYSENAAALGPQDDAEFEGAPLDAERVGGGSEGRTGEPTNRDETARLRAELATTTKRWQGLQPVVQRKEERIQALEAQLAQREAEMAAFHIQALPEEQRALAAYAFQADQERRRLATQQEQTLANVMPAAIHSQLTQWSQQYGVPLDDLLEFDTPQGALKYAEKTASRRKSERKESRRERGQDRFEGGGQVSAPPTQPTTREEAKAAFRAAVLASINRGR